MINMLEPNGVWVIKANIIAHLSVMPVRTKFIWGGGGGAETRCERSEHL